MAKNQAYPESAQAALAELKKYNKSQNAVFGQAKFARTVRKDRTKINLQNGDTFVFPTWDEILANSVSLPITGSKQKADSFPVFMENANVAKNLNPNAFGRGAVPYEEDTKAIVKLAGTDTPAPEVNWNHSSEFAKIWESAGSQEEALKAVAGFKVRITTDLVYTYNRYNNTYGYTTVITDVEIIDRGEEAATEAPAEKAGE